MTRYLVTSALPYINGIKHLGNLIGSILPADVYTRFLKQTGREALYICGTDEHGTPAEIAAADAGFDVEDYCAKMYDVQKDIYARFDIAFDYFGRSSNRSNHKLTQEMFLNMRDNGYIEEREIEQYYSKEDKRFLPDRYVEGTCPSCGFEKARGDQCDGCGRLLDPTELIHPYSSISGSRDIELIKTKHIFLNLEKAQPLLETWTKDQSTWPDVVKGIARKWLQEGLKSRCITRDLKWGVPVPLDGYEGKVFYVWFDAPNGYISITQDWAEVMGDKGLWEKWWCHENSDDVRYVQFMGKDNVPFHAIFWPAMLFAGGDHFKKVDYIKGFHWLTYDKGKFSTSQKRGVFTDTALDLFPSDYWRYYLLANAPESSDADFTFAHFASTINKDLADILGNFTNRTFSLFHKYWDGQLPLSLDEGTLDKDLLKRAEHLLNDYLTSLEAMKFRKAMQALRALWVLGNEYITEKAPWSAFKTDEKAAGVILVHCVHLLKLFAWAGFASVPGVADKIGHLLNLTVPIGALSKDDVLNFNSLQQGHTLHAPQRLFEKITDEQVEELTARFQGV